jgi:hypothetical protein
MKIQTPLFLAALFMSTAGAAIEPSQVREALPKKTESYLREGVISGGDKDTQAGMVKNLRRAVNSGFERIVLDLDSEKAPYYQAAIEPSQKRILITVFGSPRLGLNAKRIAEDFKKSSLVSRVELFPKIEDDSWTFALHLKSAVPVEVFELTAPTRIIFDLKNGGVTKPRAQAVVVPVHKAVREPLPAESDDEGNGAAARSEDIPE